MPQGEPVRSPAPPEVRIQTRAIRPSRRSHPWIFREDVLDHAAARSGSLVRVLTGSGQPVGFAFYSERSRIALRRIRASDELPGREFWHELVERAWLYRQQVVQHADAYRLLFGESDGLPGLVVDRYGEHLVVQCLTAAAEGLLPLILDELAQHMSIASVLARNDPAVRLLEGLERSVQQVQGVTPDVIEVQENGVRYHVDPWSGQKTGAFLDQRENRAAAATYSKGRVLDVFCYDGLFSLQAAPRAREAVGVDSSAPALARATRNAALNGLRNVSFFEANAFEELRRRERLAERFDLVLLDPPAFAKNKASRPAALRAYKEINLRAMRLLGPEGILVSSSCSYNLSESDFVEVLAQAAVEAGRSLRLVEKRTQARDHPIRLGFPESHYLKCVVLKVT